MRSRRPPPPRTPPGVYELYQKRDTQTFVAVFGITAMATAAVTATVTNLVPGLDSATAAVAVAAVTALGLTTWLIRLTRPAPVLRVDAEGVWVTRGPGRGMRRFAWSEIVAVVAWDDMSSQYVGVSATARRRAELRMTSGWFARFVDKRMAMPVSGTTIGWRGRSELLLGLAPAVAHFAPHVPCVDPQMHPPRRLRRRP